jgi:diguanylate cyclase (GGDEF)-like protein/PAS domain S-box-containing protein
MSGRAFPGLAGICFISGCAPHRQQQIVMPHDLCNYPNYWFYCCAEACCCCKIKKKLTKINGICRKFLIKTDSKFRQKKIPVYTDRSNFYLHGALFIMPEPASVSVNRKPVILVVDDDQLMLAILRDALTSAGFEVTQAADGVSALHYFTMVQPDLVLLDLFMPAKDGCETCREIRILPRGQYIPILMMTGLDTADSVHRAFDAGATDFIAKPINAELLVHRVRYMLRASQNVNRLAESQARLEMLKVAVDSLTIGITFCDVNGIIIYLNPAEAQMHGYEVGELIGKEARKFSPINRIRPIAAEQMKELGVWRRESVNVRKNGEEFAALLTSIPVNDSEERCLGIITTCEDISYRKVAEEKIHQLAYYDVVTGLPNRGMFLERLHQTLAQAQRDKDKVNLIFLDLDNFKDINDTQGHDVGDKLLRSVAERLSACMRDSDVLARLGGDEFVVVCPTVNAQESVAAVIQRIMAIFKAPFEIEGRQIYTSASIGIAVYPDDSQDASALFRCADTAMYQAKNDGRAQYRFFSAELNQKIIQRVALEHSLRKGMEREEFFLHYQPLWDLKTAKMVGVEVLLRWQSPEYGLMQPATFISLLEDSGLINNVGEWVLRTACNQMREWTKTEHHEMKMAVNVSGRQLKHPGFLEMLTTIIQETGVDPTKLELEFTESVIMENAEKTVEIFRKVREMGIRLSIDDFGTGYSSLNYLKHFPVDRIKIDRSFVVDINRNESDAAIIEAIVSMAQSLNLRVIAEGVENSDQLDSLTRLGCDEVQGFYLAMPMHAEALAKILGRTHGKQIGKLPITQWYDNRTE